MRFFVYIYINTKRGPVRILKNYYLPTIANYIKIRLVLSGPIVLFCSYGIYSLSGSRKASQSLWSCDYIQNQIKYYRLVELSQSCTWRYSARHQTRIRLTMYIMYYIYIIAVWRGVGTLASSIFLVNNWRMEKKFLQSKHNTLQIFRFFWREKKTFPTDHCYILLLLYTATSYIGLVMTHTGTRRLFSITFCSRSAV